MHIRRGIIAPPRLIIRRADRIRCHLRFPPRCISAMIRFTVSRPGNPSYAGYRLRRRFPRFLSKLIITEQTFNAAWDCARACASERANFNRRFFTDSGTGKDRSRNIYGGLNEFLFVHRSPMQIPRRSKLKAARNGELYLLCRAYFRAHGIFINLLLLSP